VWAREAAHGLCRRLEQYIVEDAAVQCAVLYAATVQLFGGQAPLMKARSHHKAIDCLPRHLFDFDVAGDTR